MRSYSSTVIAYLSARQGVKSRSLIWIEARDRTTGTPAAMGFWNGDDHQTFTVEGEIRKYYGAGVIVGLDAIRFQVGLDVRMQRVTLASTAPEVQQALLDYDPRFARVSIHKALFEPVGGALVEISERKFLGTLDQAPRRSSAVGGTSGVDLTLASASRWLTRALPLRKSDEALRRRNANDAFRKWAGISGDIPLYWGEDKQSVSGNG